MMSNGSDIEGMRMVDVVCLFAEMDFFDNLPLAVRRRLAHGVFKMSARDCHNIVDRCGLSITLQMIDETEREALQAARRMKSS